MFKNIQNHTKKTQNKNKYQMKKNKNKKAQTHNYNQLVVVRGNLSLGVCAKVSEGTAWCACVGVRVRARARVRVWEASFSKGYELFPDFVGALLPEKHEAGGARDDACWTGTNEDASMTPVEQAGAQLCTWRSLHTASCALFPSP